MLGKVKPTVFIFDLPLSLFAADADEQISDAQPNIWPMSD